jgi:hypothetical protein
MNSAALYRAWLPERWRDVVSIASLAVTAIGFAVALWQIRRATSAAIAAEKAADRALRESQKSFHRYTAANAHRYVSEVKIHIRNTAWPLSAARLADLADHAAQLDNEDASWKQIAGQLRKCEGACDGQSDPASQTPFATDKWEKFILKLQARIDAYSGPFPPVEEREEP